MAVVDLRMAFILMDSDNDGRVTAMEIQNMLSSLGIVLREEAVVNLVRQASQSGWLYFPLHFIRNEKLQYQQYASGNGKYVVHMPLNSWWTWPD